MADIITSLGITGASDFSGIKASLLYSDGSLIAERQGSLFFPYSTELKQKIFTAHAEMQRLYHYRGHIPLNSSKLIRRLNMVSPKKDMIRNLSDELTHWFEQVGQTLLQRTRKRSIDVLGFNGQPILFKNRTQNSQPVFFGLGNALKVAQQFKCQTVYGFADDDIRQGGNGLPLSSIYLQALLHYSSCRGFIDGQRPLAIVDVQDMVQITILHPGDVPVAFVIGPGTVLVDEFMQRNFQKSNDDDGTLASKGELDEPLLSKWVSLIRENESQASLSFQDFQGFLTEAAQCLAAVDCVATLTAFTARTIQENLRKHHIDTIVLIGRYIHNNFFETLLNPFFKLIPLGTLNWDEHFIESEQYAFLAIRSLLSLPTSFPTTTGVPKPARCGYLTLPESFCRDMNNFEKSA